MTCDDTFREIQRLEKDKRDIREGADALYSMKQPGRKSLDDWLNNEDTRKKAAERALGERHPAIGANGQPINFGQLLDALGEDAAPPVAADLIGLTKGWEELDPKSFDDYRLNRDNKEAFANRMAAAFAEAGEVISNNELMAAIQKNGAPFAYILENQSRLQVYADITRVHMSDVVGGLADIIDTTGQPPTKQDLARFTKAYVMAVYAHQMRALGSKRSGQLLRNYRRFNYDSQGFADQLALALEAQVPEAVAAAEELTTKPTPDGERVLKGPADYVAEDEVTGKVFEAAIEGKAGVPELREIQKTLILDGVDPKVGPGSKQWQRTWAAAARAGYKDSILFNWGTQGRANYLSQKIVFAVEGLKAMASNPWRLMEGSGMRQLDLFDPTANGFFRNFFKAQLDGHRMTLTAKLLAESQIQSAWKDLSWWDRQVASKADAINEGFFEGRTPFASNVDAFTGMDKGQLSPKKQYEAGMAILSAPFEGGPVQRSLQMRNKIHWGYKMLANKLVANPLMKKLGLPELPVMSSLQMMQAVDQRQGMRVFMVHRANEMLLETAKKYPRLEYKQWVEMVEPQMDELLIKALPTQNQVASYRKQFNLGSEITDEMISSKLAAENVGYPLLDTPEAQQAMEASRYQRMQGQLEGGAGRIDRAAQTLRQDERFDAVMSFWKSPFNAFVWDLVLAKQPIKAAIRVLQIGGQLAQGKSPSVQQLAEAQAALGLTMTLLTSWAALRGSGLIVSGGPINKERRKAWRENLQQQGKVPNSIAGVPLGGVPLANTLFLYNDIADVIEYERMNGIDAMRALDDLTGVMAATIMRVPGFKQFEMLMEMLSERNIESAARTVGFQLNSWFNPGSGVMRDAERATRGGRYDQYRLRLEDWTREETSMFDPSAGPDAAINKAWAGLSQIAYESAPALAYWGGGVPIKEKTYLGRDMRRPPGAAAYDWVMGIGQRDGEGEWMVENQLESMGLLQPPPAVFTGTLEDIPISPDLQKEYNETYGAMRSPNGFGMDVESMGQGVAKVPTNFRGELVESDVDYSMLLNRLTKGRTLREALNAFFRDPVFKELESNPLTSQDPKINRLDPKERRRMPAQQIVLKLHNYYRELTDTAIENSDSPGAMEWKENRRLKDYEEAVPLDSVMDLQQLLQ